MWFGEFSFYPEGTGEPSESFIRGVAWADLSSKMITLAVEETSEHGVTMGAGQAGKDS